jgi:hypothetical protein
VLAEWVAAGWNVERIADRHGPSGGRRRGQSSRGAPSTGPAGSPGAAGPGGPAPGGGCRRCGPWGAEGAPAGRGVGRLVSDVRPSPGSRAMHGAADLVGRNRSPSGELGLRTDPAEAAAAADKVRRRWTWPCAKTTPLADVRLVPGRFRPLLG